MGLERDPFSLVRITEELEFTRRLYKARLFPGRVSCLPYQ
jgi:hypothetical protein